MPLPLLEPELLPLLEPELPPLLEPELPPLLEPELPPLLEPELPPLEPPSLETPHAVAQAEHCVRADWTADVQAVDGVHAAASTPGGQPQARVAAHALLTAAISVVHDVLTHEAHVAARTPPFGQLVTE
jgi:hypothetical protein